MKRAAAHLVASFLTPLVMPFLLLLVWSVMADVLMSPIILPTPEKVFDNLASPFSDIIALGSLLYNLGFSLARVVIGFGLCVLIGVPLGILMGYSRSANRLFVGVTSLMRAIPPLAWAPVILAWCGTASLTSLLDIPLGPFYVFGHNIKFSMLCIIFVGGFFPVLTSAEHGVRQVPDTYVESAVMLGGSRRDIFCKVLLPASVPAIVGGMRISLGMCWMCVVAAEMMPGTPVGLGCMIMQAFSIGRTDVVITGMVCIGLCSALMDWLFRTLEARFLFWKKDAR